MDQPLFNQQVTFIYTTDLAAGSAFLAEKLGLELVLNQNDTCHIYKVAETSFLGICINRAPPENPGVTYSFVSSDVDAAYEILRARGVEFEAPPAYSERFKVYSAFFRGPENYRFELQAFRDPAWKSPT
ncbi:MAG: VOC family protein [Alphaproteobacteria bacterium]|jgi:catechol 2,3-dioxygenase-like lactoylglutathione lyase family enzyme|nr:VOC family protein [Alphaproteobacteria bacterium]